MIFSFFEKKKLLDVKSLKVDLHSHLIPSIDDGAKDIDESISLIKSLYSLGYQKLITTPHIMSDAYKNDTNIINQGLNLINDRLIQENIDIDIDIAAEYYLDDGFFDKLENSQILSINGKYLLFETSYIFKPIQLEDMIFAISSTGYIPLMAHPERYCYIKDMKHEYTRFKDLGVMFQVNINSFGRYYGKDAYAKALFLSKEGMIDFLGSDTHHIKQTQILKKVLHSKEYKEIFKNNQILNDTLFSKNMI
jgi:tyrosine-protein phosphatase YwqE